MYKIGVIGAGQLGSRHLQGLAGIGLDTELFVVDPSKTSLEIARSRYLEVAKVSTTQTVAFFNHIKDLPTELDLVIIATNSDVRAEVTTQILSHSKVSAILFEKVLFQKLSEYYAIEKLLTSTGVKAWVNCPRRIFGIYNQVKEFFKDDSAVSMSVHGGNWGLACNSIHFLDLMSFLNQSELKTVNTQFLDQEIIPSKRDGFLEFTGILKADYENGATLIMESVRESSLPHVISVHSANKRVLVFEPLRKALFLNSNAETEQSEVLFEFPYQSSLSGQVASEIIINGRSGLATYGESVSLHIPFLSSLIDFLNGHGLKEHDSCPIT